MFSRRYVITSLASAFVAVATSGAMAAEPIKVVASFSIIGDLVKQVGGDRVEVTTLVGPDGDAHVYSPSPADAKAVTEAKLVFVNGLGFEGWMGRLSQAAGSFAKQITVSTRVVPLAAQEDEHGHGHDHGHSHGKADPHAFQSIANVKIYVRNIRNALISVDPTSNATYEANTVAYIAKLDELDAEVRAAAAAIPPKQRRVITSHDAFAYFGKAYGFEFVAPQGVSTDAEPTAKQVASLIRQIRDQGVKAIFVENITDQRLITRIAEESGAKLGGALYSDALSPPDGPAGTYIDMIRHNIKTLSAGLSS